MINHLFLFRLFSGLIISLFFLSCSWQEEEIQKKIVLKIESNEFSAKQFAEELAKRLSRYDSLTAKDPKNVNRVKNEVINDFIMSSILRHWALKENLQVRKDLLESEIKKIRSGFPDDFSFREELSRQGLSVNQWQKNLESHILENIALKKIGKDIVDPTKEEINNYYESNKQKYKQLEKIFLQQIVLADKSDAEHVQLAIKQKKSFELLAKQFSITPEAKNGGIVGWVEKGTLEIFDQVFENPIGKPSDVIQSPYGFHIIIVLKKLPGSFLTLTQTQEIIKRELKSKKEQAYFSAWLDQQIRSTHVFKDQKLIDKMFIETRK